MWKPAKDDVSGWCTLCFGRLNVSRPRDNLRGNNEADDIKCSDSETSDASTSRRISCLGGTLPLISIVVHMDQVPLFFVVLSTINLQRDCLLLYTYYPY